MAAQWTKIGKVTFAGETTITYKLEGTDFIVESRKRQIPHASRPGTWELTTFFVKRGREELIERRSLADAKRFAEVAARIDEEDEVEA